MDKQALLQNVRLQFISHFTDKYGYLDSIEMALRGGCRWIQLRMKEAEEKQILPIAIEAQQLCKKYESTFIIDDQVFLAKKINADGVHLGKKDMPIEEARRILGNHFIIGGTANTFEDIVLHTKAGADYIGCGPFRFTTTKKNLSPTLGIEGYRVIVNQMEREKISLPIVAIGGIEADDIPTIMKTGVSGIALSGTILRAPDPVNEMQNIINIMKNEI